MPSLLRTAELTRRSRFNKIGNREMYMNCAVVEVVPKGTHSKRQTFSQKKISARDVARTNVAAQSSLASLPDLFVANLKAINNCVTVETTDVVFDAPGNDVAFADGKSSGAAASFAKDKCTGKGSQNADVSSSSSSLPPSGPPPPGASSSGNNEKPQPSPSSSKCDNSDGQWHPDCPGSSSSQKAASSSMSTEAAPAQQAPQQQSMQDVRTGKEPSAKVEQQLDVYLSGLYGGKVPSGKRDVGAVGPAKEKLVVSKRYCSKSSPKSTLKANNTSDSEHHITLQQELSDVAGNDGPIKMPYPGDGNTARTIESKKNETSIIMAKLQMIEGLGAELLRVVSQRKGGKVNARSLDVNATLITSNTTANTTAVSPQPSTFDLFMSYLSRLQTTVIECLRGFTGTTPVAANGTAVAGANTTTVAAWKRQTAVPDPGSDGEAQALDWSGMLDGFPGANAHVGTDDDKDSMATPSSLHAPVQPGSLVANITSANATNLLQIAADEAAAESAASSSSKSSSSTLSSATSLPEPDIATTFPYFLAPGPVQWPGPNNPGEGNLETMPTIVDDLGPGSEDAVRKWFEDLAGGKLDEDLVGGKDGSGEGI
jgi:hypothetical protein